MPEKTQQSHKLPKYYFVESSSPPSLEQHNSMPWTFSSTRVYGRTVLVPRQNVGTTSWTFSELCGSTLGPADYITLSSTYGTLILTNVPITIALQKNEARRFITLLDALYEARCKLLVTVEAGPDDTFSPEIQPRASTSPSSSGFSSSTSSSRVTSTEDPDATYAETLPEAYQDATAPFRPNVSSYEPSLSADALEDGPPNQARRPGSSCSTGEATATAPTLDARQPSPARTSASRTSARSRLWEMCGAWWWACEEPGWW